MKVIPQRGKCSNAAMLLILSIFNVGAIADVVPADKFDLSEWNITLPTDENNDGKPDSVSVKDIQDFSHPDFFLPRRKRRYGIYVSKQSANNRKFQ